jgi:hypothetical protein
MACPACKRLTAHFGAMVVSAQRTMSPFAYEALSWGKEAVVTFEMLDPVQVGGPVRIGGFLPGPDWLDADLACMQDLPAAAPAAWPPAGGMRAK